MKNFVFCGSVFASVVAGITLFGFRQQPVRVMAVGDSLTVGMTRPLTDMNGGYRLKLASNLGSGYLMVGPVADGAGNYDAYSGWTATQLQQQFPPCVANYAPNVVILMAGTNDIRLGATPSSAAANVMVLANSTGCTTYVMPIPPVTSTYYPQLTETRREQFNTALQNLVVDSNLRWIETRDIITTADLSSDGIHLLNTSYAKLADRIASVVKSG